MCVGVISDTHGYLNRHVARHFAGVEHIIHGGDIGREEILARLREIAPVTVVTGNVDWGTPLDNVYRRVERLELAGYRIYVTHIADKPARLVCELPTPRPDVYIYGHSHVPLIETIEGVLFLNPGAAGQPRFGRPPSIAILDLGDAPRAELIPL